MFNGLKDPLTERSFDSQHYACFPLMLIAWSLALAVNVTDVNGNTEKGMENELKKLSDYSNKVERQRLHTLILAIVGLTVSVVCSFLPYCALNMLNMIAQAASIVLLTYAFMYELRADTDLLSIFHDMALLSLKEGSAIIKALESSDEQTSTPSRQPGSTLSNGLARLTSSMDSFSAKLISFMYSILETIFSSYIIEFAGLFNAALNLATRVSGLSIELQPLLSTFTMIVPISASILLGLSQWSERMAVRGLVESICTSVWLKMLKEVRPLLFLNFMIVLFLYVFYIFLIYLIPILSTSSTGASYILTAGDILADSFYFGSGLGLLASLAFLMMLLTFFRDFIHLVCSAGANTGK
jgi:hypothetical protein